MKDSVQVPLPLLGTVTVNREELAFLAGVGVLVALDILEWPVAAILATGSVLSRDRSNKTLHAFGEALEEA